MRMTSRGCGTPRTRATTQSTRGAGLPEGDVPVGAAQAEGGDRQERNDDEGHSVATPAGEEGCASNCRRHIPPRERLRRGGSRQIPQADGVVIDVDVGIRREYQGAPG